MIVVECEMSTALNLQLNPLKNSHFTFTVSQFTAQAALCAAFF